MSSVTHIDANQTNFTEAAQSYLSGDTLTEIFLQIVRAKITKVPLKPDGDTNEQILSIIEQNELLLPKLAHDLRSIYSQKDESLPRILDLVADILFVFTPKSQQFCKNFAELGCLESVVDILNSALVGKNVEISDKSICKFLVTIANVIDIVRDQKRTIVEKFNGKIVAEIFEAGNKCLEIFTLYLLAVASDGDEINSMFIFTEYFPKVQNIVENLSDYISDSVQFYTDLGYLPDKRAGILQALMIFARAEKNSRAIMTQTKLTEKLEDVFDLNIDHIDFLAAQLLWELSFVEENRQVLFV